jgi:acyl carrier protein
MEKLRIALTQKIIDELGLWDLQAEQLTADTPFFGDDGLGIDSVDILELVVMLQRDYGVTIESRELGEKVFVTLGSLAQYVAENRQGN